jgi:hypothetical protein
VILNGWSSVLNVWIIFPCNFHFCIIKACDGIQEFLSMTVYSRGFLYLSNFLEDVRILENI